MTRFDDGLGVNTDDPDDLEIGCQAYSKTRTKYGDYPRGGPVVAINLDGDDSLLSVFTMEQGEGGRCDTFELDRSDIDMETVTWYGQYAATAAKVINQWLSGRRAPRDVHVRLMWQRRALDLAEAAASGQWLPGAERRFRRAEAARHAS